MMNACIIPINGIFQVTESILATYIATYHRLYCTKGIGLRKKNQYRFARRLAGLTMLKLNFERGAKFSDMQAGIVYVISNKSYPLHFKIGMTIELNNRLDTYQTYDPYRNFKVEKYDFVLNRQHIEKQILNHPDITNEQGEWILKENTIDIFERICFYSGIAQ